MTVVSLALLALAVGPAGAGGADVMGVRAVKTGPGLFGCEVTVGHRDIGWKHYAVPADVSRVTVRAHDKEHGYGGAEQTVDLSQ